MTNKPRDLPKGWDAADALADGWTAENIAKAARWLPITAAAQTEPAPTEAPPPAPPPEGEPLPYGFELRTGGLYYLKPGGSKGGGDESPPVYVSPEIRIIAVSRNLNGDDYGRFVEFRDLDRVTRREVILDRERQGSGDALRARMAALGFEPGTTPESRRLFLDYLRRSVPAARARTVTRTGWTPGGGAFVLPGGRVIGEDGSEPVVLALDGEPAAVAVRGTLEGWRETTGAPCVGNSRLLLAVSMSFAAPLLYWAAEESGGFHLLGKSTNASSSGKTTTMRVAASVCGDPYRYLRSWRTTDNATESIAEAHNDLPLFLDEMSQSEAKTVGDTAYMLGNGAGKTRMDRNAGGRPAKTWRVEYLSTGESSLAAHMATANRKVTAGQEVRMIEIPADAGAGHGVFEDLHGYANGADFAAALTAGAREHHGAPLIAWLEAIQRQRDALPGAIQRHRDAFTADALAGIADPPGQVRRVANRFGLLAVAGELATMEGLTGWPAGAANDAARRCFRDWLTARGGAIPAEERDLVRTVRLFFEQHSNRFRWKDRAMDDHAPEVPRQCGFKDAPTGNDGAIIYYCFPETFRFEIVQGHDPKEAARVLIRRGIMKPGDKDHATQKVRLPGFGNAVRVYVFDADEIRAA